MLPVYLDNAATTRVRDEALAEMMPVLMQDFGNPSGVHSFSRAARHCLDTARSRVASALRCRPANILFTSGGTESDNLAIRSAVLSFPCRSGTVPQVITVRTEHHAVLNTLNAYAARGLISLRYLEPDRFGRVCPDEVRNAVTSETALVTVMAANNETGNLMPVSEIGRICRDAGVLFHTDAVQAFGHIPLDAESLCADFVSVSSHKIHGPKGAGALYCADPKRIRPLMFGGMQENGLRPGTENVPALAGFGKAAECAVSGLDAKMGAVRVLRDRLMESILEQTGCASLNTDPDRSLPNILNVTFRGVDGKALLLLMDMEGIAVSAGAACAAGSPEPSHVLLAMGLSRQDAYSSVRFSLSEFTTEEEIERVCSVLPDLLRRAAF
ncbi:MAG: cysteine desulfurase [Clostridia bacterium]|nr:cysteine desulfurase [Clostridia bacterium]MBR0444011.1 cysteine desulfurase [Clostridia bacterium]